MGQLESEQTSEEFKKFEKENTIQNKNGGSTGGERIYEIETENGEKRRSENPLVPLIEEGDDEEDDEK